MSGPVQPIGRNPARALPLPAALPLVWLVLAALFLPTLRHLASVWFGNVVFHHQPLVAAIALALIAARLPAADGPAAGAARPVWPVAAAAAVSWGWFVAWLADLAIGMHAALLLLLDLAVLALVPREAWRRLAFPLGYLLLAIPAGLALVPALMHWTAWLALAILNVFDVPFWRDGFVIELATPRGLARFSIEAACSGVRYLFASLSVGVLFAWVAARGWRRGAVVALFALVPPVANALRAAGILWLAAAAGLARAQAIDHRIYGLAFFLLTLALSFALAWPLTERRPPRPPARAGRRAGAVVPAGRLLAFIAAAALGPMLALLWRLLV